MNHHITLLGLLLLVQTSLSALTCTWEGNTNADWHTASNWDTGQVPTSADDVIIVDGGTNIAANSVGACRNLEVGGFFSSLLLLSGASLKIFGDLTYNGGSITSSNNSYIMFVGSTLQTTNGYTPLTVHNVVVSNSSGLLMNSNMTVFLSLSLQSGFIYTNNNFLKAGSISGYNSSQFVVTGDNLGNAGNTGGLSLTVSSGGSTFFPVGMRSSSYNPVSISNSVGPTDVFTAYVSPTGLSQNGIQRSWFITESVGGGNTVGLTLNWNSGQEGTSFNRAVCSVYRSNDGSSIDFTGYMPAVGAAGSGSVGYAMSLGGISFESAFWTVNNEVSVLPITLIDFKVIQKNDKVNISWLIDVYSNPDYFVVEKSIDGLEFFPANKVLAHDGSLYQVETTADPGLRYYRLQMVDLEGEITYSKVIALDGVGRGGLALRIFPNPVENRAKLELDGSSAGLWEASIFDQLGRRVMEQALSIENGKTLSTLDLSHLPSGWYSLQLTQANGRTETLRLLKQ